MEPVEKMKVNPFPITQQHNGWLISWPGFRNISRVENKQKLADLIFDSIGAQEARFGVRLDDGETKFLHIRSSDWAADRSGYLDDLLDRYEITGVLLNSEESAQWLQDYLEKRLMWRRLSAQPA
jgi:hypothetical protein